MKKILFFLILCSQFSFSQELALVKQNGKIGYLDKTGKLAIKPAYEKARGFSDGLAAVKDQTKWGFIDAKGKWVIPASFDDAEDFNSGLCVVEKDKKRFYIKKIMKMNK